MSKTLATISIGATVLVAVTATAAAQVPPPPPPPAASAPIPPADPTVRNHDGVFLRMWIGPGYTSLKADGVEVSGSGGGLGIALGGAVRDGLIVFAELFDDIATAPDITIGGMTGTADEDTAAGVVGFGIGVAHYFPNNVYVSGALTSAKITVQENGETIGETDFGIGLSAMVGKEWWVSDNWGLGVAGQLFVGRMKDKDPDDVTWRASAFAVVFSATYN